MTYLANDITIRRLARSLRDLTDDELGSLHRSASDLGRDAAESEMFRRIAFKVPPTREPMWIEEMMGGVKEEREVA